MTPEHTKLALALALHTALITGAWETLRTIMTEHVTWNSPGDNAISGTAAGVDADIARAELIAGYGLTFTLEHVLFSRDNMALALHNTATRGDVILDEHLATVCRIDGERIGAIETYLSDVEGMNAFFTPQPQ